MPNPFIYDRPLAAALTEAVDGLQRTWDSLSTNQRRLVRVLAGGQSHPLRAAALAQAGMPKSSMVDARDQLAAQGDLFVHPGGRVELTDPFLAAWALRGSARLHRLLSSAPAGPSSTPHP